MKKIALIAIAILSLVSVNLSAQILDEQNQVARDGFYDKIYHKQIKPFEFPYVREADVVWEWRIWRVIDFREKMNQVFYYPLDPEQGKVNLFYALETAILEGKIKIYEDDEFKREITDWPSLKKSFTPPISTTIERMDMDGTIQLIDSLIERNISNEDIRTLRLKEDWFIDKNRSVMDVRISGFSPIYYQIKEEGSAPIPIPLFWVRYNDPEVRDLLANVEVFNERNNAERRSYDDIFIKRYFTSYIIRESNRFERAIGTYLIGADALAESEKISDKVFDIEDDMWEY